MLPAEFSCFFFAMGCANRQVVKMSTESLVNATITIRSKPWHNDPSIIHLETKVLHWCMACQTLHYSIFLYFYRILLHYHGIFWDLYLISGHFYSICFVSILYSMICIQYIRLFLLYNFRLYCIFIHLHCIFLDLYLISGHFYSILLHY